MYIISEWCPNMTILKLSSTIRVSFNDDFYWISDVTDFQNLEKLEIDINIDNHVHRLRDDYEAYLDMLYTFFEFPMYNLKELKLRRVNAFCQDEFLGYLSDAFPNLETLVIEEAYCMYVNLNDQKTSHFCWCIPGMLGTYTIPKWKEFLKSRGRFLK